MKVLFVMDTRTDRGSIQAVASYVRVGDQLGHFMALYGRGNQDFPGLRFSTDLGAFDFVVCVVEGWGWISGPLGPRILSDVPRERRAVLDADGMYNPTIAVDGDDRNHANEWDRREWLARYEVLADRIFQPTLDPREPRVQALPFYGYDPAAQIGGAGSPPKQFDILHVGHNWWRWWEVSNRLLPAIERIRAHVNGICFVGSWWDALPAAASNPNLKGAFGLDPDRFQRLGIQVRPPVSYTAVIPAMSEGRVNIMTQRPLFRHLKLLTSKYFEVFCADTIPLVMLDPDDAEAVYGPAGRELALDDRIDDKLLDALEQPRKYQEIVEEVRHHLVAHHSYEVRVHELVAALEA